MTLFSLYSNVRIVLKISFILLLVSVPSLVAETYKYKDKENNWVFTDKKPAQGIQHQEVEIETYEIALPKPTFKIEKVGQKNVLMVDNPIHAPMEIKVWWADNRHASIEKVVPANSEISLLTETGSLSNYQITWRIGSPESKPAKYLYQVPIGTDVPHVISQGFLGRYSHFVPSAEYAIDVVADVGTPVVAARPGTVVWFKDDYHISGTQAYFLDKANYVMILHDDGTFATYAHTLLGSVAVELGQHVEQGDFLAKTGNSGFSTGPHLHFVVQRNAGLSTVSVAFQIADRDGNPVVPRTGMNLYGKSDSVNKKDNTTKDFRTIELLEFAVEEEQETEEELSVEEFAEEVALDSVCEQARMEVFKFLLDAPVYLGADDVIRVDWIFDQYTGGRDYYKADEHESTKLYLVEVMEEACYEPYSVDALIFYADEWAQEQACEWAHNKADDLALPRKRNEPDVIAKGRETAEEVCNGNIPYYEVR